MDLKVQLQGGDVLRESMRSLPGRFAGQAMRTALNKAAKVVQDAARQELNDRGYSRRTVISVVRRNQRNPNPRTVMVSVGYLRRAYFLLFIELGADEHEITVDPFKGHMGFITSGGRSVSFGESSDHPGVKNSRPWLRPAFQKNVRKVLETFGAEIWPQIAKAAERAESNRQSSRVGRRGR